MSRAEKSRSNERQSQRRYASHSNVRHSVAVEAARLLYGREYKEYFQAKREAARRQSTTVLPTNSEIHQQLLLLADKIEGKDRTTRLRGMREAALEVMDVLQAFEPRLIGSTWTGHIRQGSDIDLNLYGESLESVMAALEQAMIPFEVERVVSRKQGQAREFTHLHAFHASGLPVEITLYEPAELKVHPTCSITGGPMPRGTLAQLRQRLQEEQGDHDGPSELQAAERSAQLYPLQLEAVLSELPELIDCRGVQQNHYHHLDVYDHTLDVVRRLEALLDPGSNALDPFEDALAEHFASPGPLGWSRPSVLILAGLCHDIGKPATWNLHSSGRIQFHGHEKVGETLTRRIGERWGLPPAVIERVARLVALHMEPVRYVSNPGPPSTLHRLFSESGDLAPELFLLSVADVASAQGPASPRERAGEQIAFAREMLEEYFERGFLRFPNLPVSTVDLDMELGIGEGRLRDKLMQRLVSAYVDEEFLGREDGLAYAAELLETPLFEL